MNKGLQKENKSTSPLTFCASTGAVSSGVAEAQQWLLISRAKRGKRKRE